jgi:hypothetical protein
VVFDDRRLLDPYFKALHHDRNEPAMSHHWHMIQHDCNKWHIIVKEVHRVHVSCTNFDNEVSSRRFHCALSAVGCPGM